MKNGEKHEYARSLIEASLDPLIAINTQGKITDMNQATVNIIGLNRDELTGTDFFDYFTQPQKAREVYQEVFAKGFVADSSLTLRHKSGFLTEVLFNGAVYNNNNGDAKGVVIVARDVTEQKRIARESHEAKLFAELGANIAEEAKIKAENATHIAEDATKTKQQFLSNMSHEIRTPMTAIIGFAKVLLRTKLTEKQKEYLQAIEASGNSLITLINDILDLAKVDAGKMTFEQIPFNIASSITTIFHLFEPEIHEKNLILVKNYDSKIPDYLIGDPVRLHQIFLNLVSNAVKFTKEGTITLGAKLISDDNTNALVEFSVEDTGIGIESSMIEMIFENFQQATKSTSRLYGGTGLGLAIVKKLVESQNGSMTVKSTIAKGTTFSFLLSFLKSDAQIKSKSEIVTSASLNVNLKILVVEDIPINQLLMKTILDDFGFDYDIASNGKIAIEKLQSTPYDLILMDLLMPEMTGFEATKYIRENLKSKIPILAITADVTTVDLAKCKAAGINDYIAKPVDDRLLLNKILMLAKNHPQSKSNKKRITSAPIPRQKYCNLEYLYVRTKSNPVLIKEMITLYIDQTQTIVEMMETNLQNNDWVGLQSAAHKLIPSFSIMGINRDYEYMTKKVIEYANHPQQFEKIPELVLQLINVCTNACEELKVELIRIKKM
jgi:PAS domain S-box-containing protein